MQKIAVLVLAGSLPAGVVCAEVLSSSVYDYGGAGVLRSEMGVGSLSNIDAILTHKVVGITSAKEVVGIRGEWLAGEEAPVTVALCLDNPLTDCTIAIHAWAVFFCKIDFCRGSAICISLSGDS